jgi:ubiquitin-conjugating enzyme E2 variant
VSENARLFQKDCLLSMKNDLIKISTGFLRPALRKLSIKKSHASSEFPLRLMDIFWVALTVGLVAAQAVRLGGATGIWNWWSLAVVLIALPVADFISGCIHWTFDTWGSEKVFWIGPRLIRPFRVHHAKPEDLLGTHFFTTFADSAFAMLPVLFVAFFIPLGSLAGQLIALFLVAVGVAFLPTNQIHKWAHTAKPPIVVAWLQRRRLILSPRHHGTHHAPPHTDNYCITTGWCNPVLSRIGFFRKMEWLVTKLTGMKPRHEEESHAQNSQHACATSKS